MAKFWKHLQRHEDVVAKRPITLEELRFLADLQKEMNEQDHCGTADPRYWVIRDFKKVYGTEMNNCDGVCVYNSPDCCTIYEGEFDKEKILKELKDYCDEYDYSFEDYEDDVYSEDSLRDFFEHNEFEGFDVCEYQEVETFDYFFFTEKAAADYLKRNEHHHSKKATTFCCYSWRNPEAEKMWKILHEVDFQSIIMHLEGAVNE